MTPYQASPSWLDLIRLDNFLVPMRCIANLGCFPQGKASSHSTVLPSFIPSFPVRSVIVFPYHWLWGLLFYDRWIWDLQRAHKFGCLPYTQRRVRHKQQTSLRKKKDDSEGKKNCPSACPVRGSNPGSLELNSNTLTMSPNIMLNCHQAND